MHQTHTDMTDFERQLRNEGDAIVQLGLERNQALIRLSEMENEMANLIAQLQLRERTEVRQLNSAKMLQLQLTIATQLYGVAESLTQVSAVRSASHSRDVTERNKEVRELRRALKRQQSLMSDAHRQLLELSTCKKPLGAGSELPTDVSALRIAVAEQEMARMMAEARADELHVQVRLLEEQSLRWRLHPQSPGDKDARIQ